MTFQNQLNMQIVIPSLLVLLNPYLTKSHHKLILLPLHCQNPYYHLRNQISILIVPQKIPLTKMNDNSPSKTIIKTHHGKLSLDKSRHPSQNQPILPETKIDRNTKTHYNLRQQPKKDYRLFMTPSKL